MAHRTGPLHPLIARLIEIQARENLSARKFAMKLGVAHTTWTRARNNEIGLGMDLLNGALRCYPELSYFHVQAVQQGAPAGAERARAKAVAG